ncbi:sensor histidine kinase [Mucilaginibacter lutimaris]|uniref:histidine kinase n=1 Tax=Mucilaginibacter lutimaris TaxID=931629 RepID=A0ABW2ZEQ2_9SPHI
MAVLLLTFICAGVFIIGKLRRAKKVINRINQKQRETEHRLTECLDEREWLIGEVNHRVKNNLQVISSLLSNQSAYLTGAYALDTIKTAQRRLHTISLAYHNMYVSEQLSNINLRQYVSALLNYLKDEYNAGELIVINKEVIDISLGIQVTIPLGLIIYEAVSNAIKFAFPDTRKGVINIKITEKENNKLLLIVSDNGAGFNDSYDPAQSNSLGLSLITGLSRQLGAEADIISDRGLTVTVEFQFTEA